MVEPVGAPVFGAGGSLDPGLHFDGAEAAAVAQTGQIGCGATDPFRSS